MGEIVVNLSEGEEKWDDENHESSLIFPWLPSIPWTNNNEKAICKFDINYALQEAE